MNIQKLIQLNKLKKGKEALDVETKEIEETSFIKNNNEMKKLISPGSRRSKSKSANSNESDHSLRSPRNTSEEEKILSQPSSSSQKGLLKSEENDSKKIKNRKKVNIVKKFEENLINQGEGHLNDAYESDVSQGVGVKKNFEEKVKKTRKRPVKKEINKDSTDFSILAVIIHQSDKLRTDINMYHPIVRVHIVDLDMDGQYVKNINKQNVLSYYEKESIKRDYIAPIMTTPYDFKVNRSIIPKWEEIIVFNEDFNYFIHEKPNCLILFEIIDSAKSADCYTNLNQRYTSQDTSTTWQRIAWAFLKMVGSDKTPNVEKKIRLQLYYNQMQYKVKSNESLVPEVYHLYKTGPLIKYPASLHVTVKSILAPNSFEPGIRSMYLLQEKNKLIESFNNQNGENQNQLEKDNSKTKENIPPMNGSELNSTKMNQEKIQNNAAMWSRVASLPCRVPNELTLKLNSTKLGCYSVKFSTHGSFLACACVDENNASPVYIYEIPSGKLVFVFHGHFGLIYEMGWSKLDKYIVTASNDATARIIDVENRAKDAFRILPHPSFLYTAKFHPNSAEIVCTSGYDKLIRIWSLDSFKKTNQKYGQLIQEIYGHNGYVNTTCFSTDGSFFYSADSIGKIFVWNCNSTNTSKDDFREWSLRDEIEIDDLKDKCINHIKLHPNQFRMIVHLRDNEIKLVDLRLQAIIKSYKSSFSFTQNVRSTITPCGSFLFSSGVDTNVYCWNVDSGDQVPVSNISLNYLKPARDIDFHPFDNLIVFCSYNIHSPIYVYKYNPDKVTKILNPLATIYSQSNTIDMRTKQSIQEQISNLYLLPNQTEDAQNEAKHLQMKFEEDMTKFNNYQANRWKNLQEKLDSVHPLQNQLLLNSGRIYPAPENFNKQVVNSSITLTMPDRQSNKPEFKYRGPKEVEDLVVVLHDYNAQRSDELDLIKGEEILVLVRENETWLMGESIRTKQQGYFPASYVQEKSLLDSSNAKLKERSKFTVKDAMVEIQKEYEISTGLNQQKHQQQPELISTTTESKNPDRIMFNNSTHGLPGKILRANNKIDKSEKYNKNNVAASETNLNHISKVDDISEVPTRDQKEESSLLKSKRRQNTSKRRPHSHIIFGNAQTSSDI